MHLHAPAHQRRTQAAAHGRESIVWSHHRLYDAGWERDRHYLLLQLCARNSDQEKPMESTPQHGQMAVCASSPGPSSISPVIDNTCAGTARRQNISLKESGKRNRWKRSRTSVVIAIENEFSVSIPCSFHINTFGQGDFDPSESLRRQQSHTKKS